MTHFDTFILDFFKETKSGNVKNKGNEGIATIDSTNLNKAEQVNPCELRLYI